MSASLSIVRDQELTHSVTEWVDWAGGTCPVHKDTFVQVRCAFEQFRDEGQMPRRADSWPWAHDVVDTTFNIISYRVAPKA